MRKLFYFQTSAFLHGYKHLNKMRFILSVIFIICIDCKSLLVSEGENNQVQKIIKLPTEISPQGKQDMVNKIKKGNFINITNLFTSKYMENRTGISSLHKNNIYLQKSKA